MLPNLVMVRLSIDPSPPCGRPRTRIRELGSIRFFNVISANVVRFLPKFVHIIIQVYGTMVANLVTVLFIFTILLSTTRCCPMILHVYAYYEANVLMLYEYSTDCCVTSVNVVIF